MGPRPGHQPDIDLRGGPSGPAWFGLESFLDLGNLMRLRPSFKGVQGDFGDLWHCWVEGKNHLHGGFSWEA